MNLNQIIVTVLTACVPAAFSYFATKKQMDSRIKEVEMQSANEIKRLEKETVLRMQELEQQQKVDLTNKFFTGELDIDKLTTSISQLSELQKFVNRLQK